MSEFPHGVRLEHFAPSEFDHPDKVDPELLELLDEVRRRCGFPIKVNSDVRPPSQTDGPHRVHEDGWGHAVDVGPAGEHDWATFHTRKMEIACTAFGLRSIWPSQGIEVASSHIHLDTSPDLKRPYYWGGKSR